MTSLTKVKGGFAKMVNIMPYQMYLEKQKQRLLGNCFNSVLLDKWRNPEIFCEQSLPSKIDFSLWNDQMQIESCFKAMETTFEELGDPFSMSNLNCVDPDSETCNPCLKTISYVFDNYQQYLHTTVVSVIKSINSFEALPSLS